jgi:AraC family transcriptional regulator
MKESTQKLYEERLLRVLVFIQRNLDEELPLEDLARVAYFSPYHFHRIFRGMVGESLKEHIRRLRLERAALRLKHTNRSVLDIALEAGFQTHESFTRAFRALLGCSPSQFRSTNGVVFKTPGVHYQNGAVETQDIASLPASGGAKMEVRIERLSPLRVAFVRHVGPYHEVGQAWEKICAKLGSEGLIGSDSRFIGVCYDDPEVTPPEKIRYDACITVGEDFTPEGEAGVQMLPGGEFAVTTHIGPYEKLNQTYAALFGQWLPSSGRELRSEPSLEFYLNDPESTDPGELLTDIYAPLEPLSQEERP